MDPSGSSSVSGHSCSHVGDYDDGDKYCPYCSWQVKCKEQTEASRAPLCELPPYMASRYFTVRQAARARFIELQESNACI